MLFFFQYAKWTARKSTLSEFAQQKETLGAMMQNFMRTEKQMMPLLVNIEDDTEIVIKL